MLIARWHGNNRADFGGMVIDNSSNSVASTVSFDFFVCIFVTTKPFKKAASPSGPLDNHLILGFTPRSMSILSSFFVYAIVHLSMFFMVQSCPKAALTSSFSFPIPLQWWIIPRTSKTFANAG
uniref:Uncharacterized protein n=1 Tax=Arundo donax TaxID=35708 RepID=A0A0A9GK26_ARUDO